MKTAFRFFSFSLARLVMIGWAFALAFGGTTAEAGSPLNTVYAFTTAGGTNPFDGPAQLANGTIYGVCYSGGTDGTGGYGGAIFAVQTDGTGFTDLHLFSGVLSGGTANPGGSRPTTAPVLASNGYLYGITQEGGTTGYGVFYQIMPDGTNYNALHNFDGTQTSDPEYTSWGVVIGSDGDFYGAGEDGGSVETIVYKLNSTGSIQGISTVFTKGSANGGTTGGQLLSGADGKIYGLTQTDSYGSASTIYKMNNDGTGFILLHTFSAADGQYPSGGLIQGPDGTLYGTTDTALTAAGATTVFKINTDGTGYTNLRTLATATEGGIMYGRLLLASDGMLYGASSYGGSTGLGTLFRISTTATNFSVLYTFTGSTDHSYPNGSLIQGLDGKIYGTTSDLTISNAYVGNGTLFSYDAGLSATAPVVTTNPSNATVDAGGTATFNAAASGSPAPTVQWQVNTGSGFSNLSGATSTTLTLNSVTTGMNGYQYQAVFTNSVSSVPTTAATLTVNPAVAATQAVASVVLTQNHAATAFTPVTGSGGTAPLTYSISPPLPTGLSLTTSTGAITGTPTVTHAASTYTVTVTDAISATASNTFSLTVNSAVAAAQAIASVTLTQNNAATPFTPVTGSGGTAPLTYSISPPLPTGLSLTTSTGAITGPSTVTHAASSFTVTVTDANSATASNTFTLTVNSAVVATQAIASVSLTQNHAVTAFTPVSGSGGTAPLTYSISPPLPTGLSLTTSTGAITGTPTVTHAASSFTVTVTDANSATASNSFTLTVNSTVVATQAVASVALTQNVPATAFTPVTGSGGTAPLTYSIAPPLPAGLSLTTSAGTITGTPTATQSATGYTVTVTDLNSATASNSFTLTVNAALSISPTTLLADTAGTPINQTITVSNGTKPYTTFSVTLFNAGGTGLAAPTTNAAAGTVNLSGTPGAGTATFTVNVTDSAGGTLTQNYTLTVSPATPTINTTQQPASAVAGNSIADKATVSGGDNPTGTVTFNLYSNSTASGPPLFTDANVPLSGGIATSTGYTTTAVSTLYWVATYNGDSNNNTVTAGTASEPVSVTGTPPVVTTNPLSQTVPAGSIATFNVAASGAPTPTVQWQMSTNGGSTFNNVSNTINIAASPAGATESGATVTMTTASPHSFSAGQSVTIAGVGVAGYNGTFTITSVPANTSFTYTASPGLGNSGGGTATAAVYTGITATTLSFPVGLTMNGYQYQAVFTNLLNTAPTTAATLTVPPIVQFSVGSETVQQSAGTFSIPVTLTGALVGPTTVPVTLGGTAVSGVDYTGVTPSPLTFAPATIAASPTGATEAGNTVTITTAAPHGFSTGQMATISGVAVAGYNGTFVIVNTPSPTTFTYIDASPSLAASGGGTATSPLITVLITGTLLSDPGVAQTLSFTLGTPANAVLGSPTVNTLTIVEPPSATLSIANLPANATTMTIGGAGFDSIAANNTVVFNDGVSGTVMSSTSTSLTVSLTTTPATTTAGSLTATVTTNGQTGPTVQVATVIPVITSSTMQFGINGNTLVITGFGFSTTSNSVTFSDGTVGTVSGTPSTTQITVTISTDPTHVGVLNATVTSNGASSGTPTQVATVVPIAGPVTIMRQPTTGVTVTAATITAGVTDPDPTDTLTLVSVGTPAHGSTRLLNGQVAYLPAHGWTTGDSFTYTVQDDAGTQISGTVTVGIIGSSGAATMSINNPTVQPGGAVLLTFSGVPNTVYGIQYSATMAVGSWVNLVDVTTDQYGDGQYTDNTHPGVSGFYRLIYPGF